MHTDTLYTDVELKNTLSKQVYKIVLQIIVWIILS